MSALANCPEESCKTVEIHGHLFTIRPICPEDEPLLREMVQRSDPEDIRLRFFVPLRDITHDLAARLSHIDHDHNMALVAIETEGPNTEKASLAGMVCVSGDPKSDCVEYAIMVRSDLKGQGLGYRLMQEILTYARQRGLGHVTGQVLSENSAMLKMVREFGGKIAGSADPGVVTVDFDLTSQAQPPV